MLSDRRGEVLADHAVDLDPRDWKVEAFDDLHRYLRWNAPPDRRAAREAQLADELGDWIGRDVLGPVAAPLAAGRGPVHLRLPGEAAALGHLPWELARVDGRTLAAHGTCVVVDHLSDRRVTKTAMGDRLRILAVFSLPDRARALNLRRERHALIRLVEEIRDTRDAAIELRVLQFGATRARLAEALRDPQGWDVVHLAGHGRAGALVLEDDTGGHDLIPAADLVDLLALGAERIQLVTLSTCESAAAAANRHLRRLGLPSRSAGVGPDGPPITAPPAVAAQVARRLDAAVLAMRYPVSDAFATSLARSFYSRLLGEGRPVPRALGESMALSLQPHRTDARGVSALSAAVPTVVGRRALDLVLVAPRGRDRVAQAAERALAGFPPASDRFVGRIGPMTRAGAALAPRSRHRGLVLHGMAGAGKTTCALELAHTHQESFRYAAWYRAPDEGADVAAVTAALRDFVLVLERELPGLTLVDRLADDEALRAALPSVRTVVERDRALVVLDNAESLLTVDGTWRDQRWGMLLGALTGHGGPSRTIVTTRRRPSALSAHLHVESVHALSLSESFLLARELPHLGALMDGDLPSSALTAEAARALAARTLSLVQGHPTLIELADGFAADPDALAARLDEADRTWLRLGARLQPFLDHDDVLDEAGYLAVLNDWTLSTVATLPAESAALFRFLCCVEDADRDRSVVTACWPRVWRHVFPTRDVPEPAPLLTAPADRDCSPWTRRAPGRRASACIRRSPRAPGPPPRPGGLRPWTRCSATTGWASSPTRWTTSRRRRRPGSSGRRPGPPRPISFARGAGTTSGTPSSSCSTATVRPRRRPWSCPCSPPPSARPRATRTSWRSAACTPVPCRGCTGSAARSA